MIVIDADAAGCDQRSPRGVVLGAGGREVHRRHSFERVEPAGASAEREVAVLIEKPIEDVVVVANRCDVADHQLQSGTALRLSRREIRVAPEWITGRPLEDTNPILEGVGGSYRIRHYGGEKGSAPRAVGATQELCSHGPETVLALVHVVAEMPTYGRILIGHEDLGERSLVEHGASSVVAIPFIPGHQRENHPHPEIPSKVKGPVLPCDHRAIDGEVATIW